MTGDKLVLCGFDSRGWVASQMGAALVGSGYQISGWSSARSEARATQLPGTFYYGASELCRVSGQTPFPAMNRSGEEELTLGYLLHRESRRSFNIYDAQAKRSLMEWRLSEFFSDTRPNFVLFEESPHNAVDFLTYLVARDCGIPTLFVIEGPVPQTFLVVDRLNARIYRPGTELVDSPAVSQQAHDYICRLQSNYAVAEPTYEREHRENSGSAKVLRRKVVTTLGKLRGPRRVSLAGTLADYRVWREQRSYEAELGAITRAAPPTPEALRSSVVVFLHLQPERTTVPECGSFANQVGAIARLRSLLSDDVHVFVREHPSTLTYRIDFVRTAQYLEMIQTIPGVDIIDSHLSPFDIIDNCLAVCTGTGTVGFESIVRGTPAVVFGMARYRGMSGVVELESLPYGADARYFHDNRPDEHQLVRSLRTIESSHNFFSIDGSPRSDQGRSSYVSNVVRIATELSLLHR